MNSSQKILAFAGLALLAGVAAFFVLQRDQQPHEPEKPAENQTTEPETRPDPTKALTSSQPALQQRNGDLSRTEIVTERSGATFPQGVKGRVVDPAGAAVVRAKVYLMPGQSTNLIEMLRAAQSGVIYPPVARGETDAQGSFALGIERVDPTRSFEVRVVTDKYVDLLVSGLRIQENDWYDAGILKVESGIQVSGIVSVAGSTGLPVPGAEISVKITGSPITAATPTPGREKGLVVKADQNGRYSIDNAPAGLVTMSAVAPNFARLERPGTNLEKANQNVVNFELQEGKIIDGVVLDPQRAPVAGAKVTAIAISSKTPVNEDARTQNDGRFEIIGLVDGPYQLTVTAQGFVTGTPVLTEAGTRGLEIMLEKQGMVRMQVYGKNGRLLSNYFVTIKTAYPNSDLYGNTEIPQKQVRNPKDGIGVVDGLNPPPAASKYLLQIEAEGHAKAFSEQFTIVPGAEPPLLVVKMNEGGVLEGQVLGADGQPLPGVSVTTLPNNLDENPFTAMFQGVIPFNITRTSVGTNAEGKFRIALLNEGVYQLKLQHSGHFDAFLKDNQVQTGQTTSVPPIRLGRGTVVTGSVRVDGAPAGQVKVTLATVQDPAKPGMAAFSAEAISDNDGKFTFAKRVPPGRYSVRAARQTLPNPILQMADYQKSQQEIEFGAGQDTFIVAVQFNSN